MIYMNTHQMAAYASVRMVASTGASWKKSVMDIVLTD